MMNPRPAALLASAALAAVLVSTLRALTRAVRSLTVSTDDLRRAAGHPAGPGTGERQARTPDPVGTRSPAYGGTCCRGDVRDEPVVVDVDAPPPPSPEALARAEALKAAAAERAGIHNI